jgi:hypothetical protein
MPMVPMPIRMRANPLPQANDAESVKPLFVRNQFHPLDLCLGDQEPVEWIIVRDRENTSQLALRSRQRQLDKPLL